MNEKISIKNVLILKKIIIPKIEIIEYLILKNKPIKIK